MTSNDESWTIESELAARTEIWQVWPLLHNAATCRKEKTSKLCPGENAGDPRSNCGVRDFPDDSRLCWSHRIPSQVNFPKTHLCQLFCTFPNNFQVDHAVDDHPGGGDDRHLALRRGQLLLSGQLGNCHPVRSSFTVIMMNILLPGQL